LLLDFSVNSSSFSTYYPACQESFIIQTLAVIFNLYNHSTRIRLRNMTEKKKMMINARLNYK